MAEIHLTVMECTGGFIDHTASMVWSKLLWSKDSFWLHIKIKSVFEGKLCCARFLCSQCVGENVELDNISLVACIGDSIH